MNKRIGLLAVMVAFALMLAGLSSAYYSDDYSNSYYEKRSIGPNGYSYVQKEVKETPWGEQVRYTKVSDNRNYNSFENPAFNYWMYGNTGYSTTKYIRDYSYGDDGRRDHFGAQYHAYYYQPSYNGKYWDWSPRCTTFDCRW